MRGDSERGDERGQREGTGERGGVQTMLLNLYSDHLEQKIFMLLRCLLENIENGLGVDVCPIW